VLTADYISSI